MDNRKDEKEFTILVVDDSEINRDMLRTILDDKYYIEEAVDGESALKMIEEKGNAYDLVLLDIIMPGMSGYDVLRELKEKYWLDSMPVIVISSENDIESICQAYELGATDYFTRPFDATVISHRVINTIMLYRKRSSDTEDAVRMLSFVYYKILKVNLTSDRHKVLRMNEEEATPEAGYNIQMSKWFKNFADLGMVHPEDVRDYLAFTRLDYLRRHFARGKKTAACRYRRKISGDYRWVSMELYQSAEYSDDHQVVILYVRDINEDFMRQMNSAVKISVGSFVSCQFNFNDSGLSSVTSKLPDEYVKNAETLDYMVDVLSKYIPEQEGKRENFLNQFHKDMIYQAFQEGHTVIEGKYPFESKGDGEPLKYVKAVVRLMHDALSESIEAVFYMVDITQEYLDETLPAALYNKEYQVVGVIDRRNRTVRLQKCAYDSQFNNMSEVYDYKDTYEKVAKEVIALQDREKFIKNLELSNIEQKLDMLDSYEFSVQGASSSGKTIVVKIHLSYLDDTKAYIVMSVEDNTEFAHTDTLTGGMNREGFFEGAKNIFNISSQDDKFALAHFNLNDFKVINEMFGLDVGDQMLRNFYMQIKNSDLKPLITGRLDADHFVALIQQENLDYDVISDICYKNVEIEGKSICINGRCGIYMIEDTGMHISGMCDRASLAGTHIENHNVQPYAVFENSMHENYIDATALTGEIEQAIANKDIKVYYQPIYDPVTKRLASAEALVRWIHPEHGMVSPGTFIPALEKKGHISKVDLYVEQEVMRFQQERYDKGLPIVPVSVNLSRMDFFDDKMIETILSDIKNSKLPKDIWRFEVTESAYASVVSRSGEVLEQMRENGAKLLLDDFGTGYSSFEMMLDHDFDIVKLDMSFIRKIGKNSKAESIITSVTDLAHRIGTKIVAEGAELEEHVEFLKHHQCDYIQGYYFSKPLPEHEFAEKLDSDDIIPV